MKPLEAGVTAPDFTLKDTQGQNVSLSEFRGKKVLLSWHPAAWTGVCTDQMRSLEVNHDKLGALNTVALGLSVDPAACKKAWAAVLTIDNTALLSDFWPHGKAATDYGIFIEQYGISQRANFIIDEKGMIKWVKIYPISQLPDMNEVLKALSEMQ